jgi:hypothetical protein
VLIERRRVGRTKQELQQASGHVRYEIWMLEATMSFLSKPAGATDQVTWNAYIESFALHLRNLIEFFYTMGQADNISAELYVSDVAQWEKDRGPKTPFLSGEKRRANKRVEHLSFGRLRTDEEGWRWAEIRAALQPVMKCFLSHLSAERKRWFEGTGLEEPSGPSGALSLPEIRGWTGPPERTGTAAVPSPAGGAGATGPAEPPGSGGGPKADD